MTIQKINYGLAPDDGTGDKLRDAFRKTDDNFTELDTRKANAQDVVDALAFKADTATVDSQLALKADATYVDTELAKKANLASPALTGTPTAPTAAPATNTDQVATTAFVQAATDSKVDKVAGKQLSTEDYTSAEKAKLGGIATGATANSTDEDLRDRSTHTGTQTLATISDAGTAASRNVTTSHRDETPGRLLKVGDFGLGSGGTATILEDLNTLKTAGLYGVLSAPNSPIGAGPIGQLLVLVYSQDWVSQTYTTAFSGTYIRSFINGTTWTPWELVTTSARATGVISNGAIIERGSNANGEYVKFADGTLICTARRTGWGAGITATPYPAEFIVVPAGGHNITPISNYDAKPTAFWCQHVEGWLVYSAIADTSNIVSFSAIGRWK